MIFCSNRSVFTVKLRLVLANIYMAGMSTHSIFVEQSGTVGTNHEVWRLCLFAPLRYLPVHS
jgi:hypothetical protein